MIDWQSRAEAAEEQAARLREALEDAGDCFHRFASNYDCDSAGLGCDSEKCRTCVSFGYVGIIFASLSEYVEDKP